MADDDYRRRSFDQLLRDVWQCGGIVDLVTVEGSISGSTGVKHYGNYEAVRMMHCGKSVRTMGFATDIDQTGVSGHYLVVRRQRWRFEGVYWVGATCLNFRGAS